MSVQRWEVLSVLLKKPRFDDPVPTYEFVVKSADHVAAVAEAEQRVTHDLICGSSVPRESCECRADALREAREAVDHFHVGSCRWYYVERRCTCGLHDAIDALAAGQAPEPLGEVIELDEVHLLDCEYRVSRHEGPCTCSGEAPEPLGEVTP